MSDSTGKFGYKALFNGRSIEVWADSSYQAQQKAAQQFKAKKSFQVDVYLCQERLADGSIRDIVTTITS